MIHTTLEYSDAAQAQAAANALCAQSLVVVAHHSRVVAEAPPSPYTTLDLLEDVALRWGWSARKTMAAAQTLFEAGLITYPRTDSAQVASEALKAGREVVAKLYGRQALSPIPASPSRMATWLKREWKKANQEDATEIAEAHEAIRPTDPASLPDDLPDLENEALALYRLIWQRFLGSQMRPVRYQILEVTFEIET